MFFKAYRHYLPYLLLLAASTYFYYPILFEGKSFAHGDNLHHGWPITHMYKEYLSGGDSPVWSDKIYGGHPLFAESQGGFSNPINFLTALFLDPLQSHSLLHWLSTILTGIGMYWLCRVLSLSVVASTFGAVGLAFSGIYLRINTNLTAIEAVVWVPWMIAGVEQWFIRPGLKAAIVLAVLTSLLLLAGYPHFLHGTIIFIFFRLMSVVLQKKQWSLIARGYKKLVIYGVVAALLAIGFTAFQWLPLMELTGQSHRSGGTKIITDIAPDIFVRGNIYSIDIRNKGFVAWYPVVGSALLCVLASLSVLLKVNTRIKSFIPPTAVLMFLGFGPSTQLFDFILEKRLVPGMHYFRAAWLYFFMAVVGVSLLAAAVVDYLSRAEALSLSKMTKISIVALLLLWLGLYVYYHVAGVDTFNYVVLFLALISIVVCRLKIPKFTSLILLLILITELVALRLIPYDFIDRDDLRYPEQLSYLKNDPDYDKYKHADITYIHGGVTFLSPYSSELPQSAIKLVNSFSPTNNVIWGVPSIDGSFALPLARRMLIERELKKELNEEVGLDRPGLRMMDVLGIRYITGMYGKNYKYLSDISRNKEMGVVLLENRYAQPKFQFYDDYSLVDSKEEAFESFKKLENKKLIIEADNKLELHSRRNHDGQLKVDIKVIVDSSTHYKLVVTTNAPGWLFIADANYPGWKGELDGREIQVFSAQVLGKAIQVPSGRHVVEVYFDPISLKIGVGITLVTLFAFLVLILRRIISDRG